MLVVHFGGGALGRGLVIPLLVESGCEVVLVDINKELIRQLCADGGYTLDVTDADDRLRHIPLKCVVDGHDVQTAARWIRETNLVTTSVLRDNLPFVAKVLADAWDGESKHTRSVLCCENIERVGGYFRSLLEDSATQAAWRNLQHICIPDTIVDRICAAHFPETTHVSAERFYECAVDSAVMPFTGIPSIISTSNITRAFDRKRLLMNTYADATAFLAIPYSMTYLYEAVTNETIHRAIADYLALLKRLLVLAYGFTMTEMDQWAESYRARLANREIPRRLDTVARNFWAKMSAGERFIQPVLQMLARRENIDAAVPFLVALLEAGGGGLPSHEIYQKLKEQWRENAFGDALLSAIQAEMR